MKNKNARLTQFRKSVTSKLKEISMKQRDIENLVGQIEGLIEKSEDEEKPKVKVNYGTSCVRMEKNGKLLTEY